MAEDFVPSDADMADLLRSTRTIAVVGLSDNPSRPSHGVAKYLKDVGYRVIPINPGLEELWGEKSFPDLTSMKKAGIDAELVDIFRRPDAVKPIAQEAVEIGASSIWLQEGVVNEEAAQLAKDAGLRVVMDRCMFKEHSRLIGS